MNSTTTTVGMLLRAFAEAHPNKPALVQLTGTAVKHLARACGASAADAITLDEYPALVGRLAAYLRA